MGTLMMHTIARSAVVIGSHLDDEVSCEVVISSDLQHGMRNTALFEYHSLPVNRAEWFTRQSFPSPADTAAGTARGREAGIAQPGKTGRLRISAACASRSSKDATLAAASSAASSTQQSGIFRPVITRSSASRTAVSEGKRSSCTSSA
jgi:hypothetical protein